jgi:hypothetical protein
MIQAFSCPHNSEKHFYVDAEQRTISLMYPSFIIGKPTYWTLLQINIPEVTLGDHLVQ